MFYLPFIVTVYHGSGGGVTLRRHVSGQGAATMAEGKRAGKG